MRARRPAELSKPRRRARYLVTIVYLHRGILALRFSSPKRARQGNLLGAAGMALAIAVTLAQDGLENFGWIGLAMVIGAVIGVVGARSVKMTAMPQMVALFNGVGGRRVALIALAEFHNLTPLPGELAAEESIAILLSALIGSIRLRLADRVREAAGAAQRPADRLSRAAIRERRRAARRSSSGADRLGAEGDLSSSR